MRLEAYVLDKPREGFDERQREQDDDSDEAVPAADVFRALTKPS